MTPLLNVRDQISHAWSNFKGISNGMREVLVLFILAQEYLIANMTNPDFRRVDILCFVLIP